MQSVSRAVSLLMLVATRKTDGTGKALAEAAGLALPTAHHLLSTLVMEGLLVRDDRSRYALGPKAVTISESIQRDLTPPGYLLAGLRELGEATGETCYIAAWREGDIHVLATAPGRHAVQVTVPTAPYRDAHARASGKLFLGHLRDEVREQYLETHPLRRLTAKTLTTRRRFEKDLADTRARGWAIDEGEFQEGVCCVAAPVMDEGIVLAVYSMSVPAQRWFQHKDMLIATTVEVAGSVQAELGSAAAAPAAARAG